MMKSSLSSGILVLVVGLAAAAATACGGASKEAEAPSGSADGADDAPADDGDGMMKFDDMSPPQKMAHMKKVVSPGMAKVFQSSDPDEYSDFGCSSCHGSGAKAGNFQMPSSELPQLTMAEIDWEDPVVKFMSEQVVPEMAKMLGEEPYNQETQEGFGCMGCHVMQ